MTLVIGYNPGGNTDTVGRHLQAYLQHHGVNAVIESKPGASGEIGSRDVSRSDGKCRILVAQSNQLTTNQIGVPNALDPQVDLLPITMLAEAPLALVVLSTGPHKTFAELERYLRLGGTKNFYGSNGYFATDHLATETLLHNLGLRATHVPYTGSGPMVQGLLSGNLDFALVSVGLVKGYVEQGRLRALGVTRPKALGTIPPLGQYSSMWVALAGSPRMATAHVAAWEHVGECFAKDPKVRHILTDEMLFDLGGGRDALLYRMKAETAEARLRFNAH